MYEQDSKKSKSRNKKIGDYKIFTFLQTPNSNFCLSVNRAICKIFGADFVIRIGYYAINYANFVIFFAQLF